MKPYYEKDNISIYQGDCLEVLPQLSKVDLIFTSPPYNLGTTTGGGFPARHGPNSKSAKWSGGLLSFGYEGHNDRMSFADYEEWQKSFLKIAWESLTENGAIYYNHKPRVLAGELWLPLRLNPGLPLRQIVIWARAGGINFSPSFYCPTHEWILIFAKPGFRLRDKGASGAGDVWRIPQARGNDHPAPFPVELPKNAIETLAPRIVCDPFCGSGSTLVAAKSLNRAAIGIELSEKYCEMAARRLDVM